MSVWIILVISGLLEGVWVTAMKASNGFTHWGYTAMTFVVAWVSFWMLGYAMRFVPQGVGYPVWVGLGAVCSVAAGAYFWGEQINLQRVLSVCLIVSGIVGLYLAEGRT